MLCDQVTLEAEAEGLHLLAGGTKDQWLSAAARRGTDSA